MTRDAWCVSVEGTVYGFLASEFCLGHLGAVGRLDSYVVAGDHAKRVLSDFYLFKTEEHKNKRLSLIPECFCK